MQSSKQSRTRVAVSVVIVLAVLGQSCQSGPRGAGPRAPASAVASPPIPRSAAECARCDGDWGVRGLATEATCNCRTKDAWRPCKDGFDCEGACLVSEAPESEIVEKGNPPRGFFLGHCSDHVSPSGCVMLIEKGARLAGPVSLAEPPQRLCID